MIAWLKDRLHPIRRTDPDYGEMRFVRDGKFWDGWTDFPPTQSRVELLLSGTPEGPTAAQRQHVAQLKARYPDLWRAIEPELCEAGSLGDGWASVEAFLLKGIDLPTDLSGEPEWELVYETQPETLVFAVQMKGWRYQDVLVGD